ncbi:DUF6491 family protein [Vitreimonas flagellata]|uniref:DUF6491 family protein n=1 Tax=Vitreimonas flagellata TaxID=2560861 RepID=UPI001074F83C|nr:DUF6491 family protein [Vitreimonas flagellata]
MRALIVLACALALGACASTAAESADTADRDCFRPMDVSGFNVVDAERLKVRVGPSREYFLTVQGGTRDIRFDETLGIDAGHSFVCTGNGLGVRVIGGDHDFPRAVTRVERVPPPSAVAPTAATSGSPH